MCLRHLPSGIVPDHHNDLIRHSSRLTLRPPRESNLAISNLSHWLLETSSRIKRSSRCYHPSWLLPEAAKFYADQAEVSLPSLIIRYSRFFCKESVFHDYSLAHPYRYIGVSPNWSGCSASQKLITLSLPDNAFYMIPRCPLQDTWPPTYYVQWQTSKAYPSLNPLLHLG